MRFRDREEAARLLAEKLSHYRGQNPLVLAIPRGAVPMGRVLADLLEGELDVVLVHKLGYPGNPELAIGAVSESGDISLHEEISQMRIPDDYIRQEAERQLSTLRERRRRFTPGRGSIDPRERIVIVLDDGVATGATLVSALKLVRAKGAKRLVAAAAVAPLANVPRIARAADEAVFLYTPEVFFAVGEFFEDFGQVSDEEVFEILSERNVSRKATAERRQER
jgi:predicted phosphoribosyltransferase